MPGFSSRGIFICYRRQDATADALLLRRKFSEGIPDAHIFMDLDSIDPGADFFEVIRQAVDSSAVLVALIGPQWAALADQAGPREDYVRLEVQTALERGVRVIPVLVNGAKPPQLRRLPSGLQDLARLNAFELSYGRYQYDADRLLDFIQRVFAELADAERQAHLDAERQAQQDAERRAQQDAEAERQAREDAACKAQEEAAHKTLLGAARTPEAAADRRAREEAARKAQEEAERRAQEEAARIAREEADRRARKEAARKVQAEAERRAREEAADKTLLGAARKPRGTG